MRHGGNVWQGESPEEWLDFSANLRPEGPPEWVKAEMTRAVAQVRYYPDPGMKRAKAALAEFLHLNEACVLPTAGGISAIRLVNLLPSSETLLLTPCFCEYEQFAASAVRKRSLLGKNHEISLPRTLNLKKNSLVWLCNPMNPTGFAFQRSEIERLLQEVEANDAYLAVDEAFIEFCPEYSVAEWIATHERLLICGSLTKILAIPGVRIGYLCAQAETLQSLQGRQITWELSCFAEAVLLALPEHRKELTAYAQQNAARRAWLAKALDELGAHVYPSESACLLVAFKRDVAPILAGLRAKKILARDCMNFDDIDDGRHLRLAVKDENANRRLIRTLEEVLSCAENH